MRATWAFRHGDALTFHTCYRSTKLVAPDLTSDGERKAFADIAATADIVLHNLRSGASAELGTGAQRSVRDTSGRSTTKSLRSTISGTMAMRPGSKPVDGT